MLNLYEKILCRIPDHRNDLKDKPDPSCFYLFKIKVMEGVFV